ncbi:MAG: ester cyclase [Acidobacteriaceae bacterium]
MNEKQDNLSVQQHIERNIAVQQKFGDTVNSGNLREFEHLVAEDSLDHDPAPGQVKGPDGYMELFSKMRQAFPDLKVSVDQLVADEDHVAIAYTMRGTHRGNFMGVAGTGKEIHAHGVQIARFRQGKMVERWGSSDELGIMRQIGAVHQQAA